MNLSNELCLRLTGIEKTYAVSQWRLRVKDFSLHSGELVCLIGPNGAGKSTLLKIAAGISCPDSGDVELCGKKLAGLQRRQIAQKLGYLPQDVRSDFDYTVEEVVRLGRYPHLKGIGVMGSSDYEVVDVCMRRVDIERFKNRTLLSLSGGERKRVFLASILAQEPKILLLDEPTSALDIQHQVLFFRLLRELVMEGLSVVVVVHEINLASLYADRLFLLSEGQVFAEGRVSQVLSRDNIASVYGSGFIMQKHPDCDRPVLLPALSADADTDTAGKGKMGHA